MGVTSFGTQGTGSYGPIFLIWGGGEYEKHQQLCCKFGVSTSKIAPINFPLYYMGTIDYSGPLPICILEQEKFMYPEYLLNLNTITILRFGNIDNLGVQYTWTWKISFLKNIPLQHIAPKLSSQTQQLLRKYTYLILCHISVVKKMLWSIPTLPQTQKITFTLSFPSTIQGHHCRTLRTCYCKVTITKNLQHSKW